jgi:hypothetical protein
MIKMTSEILKQPLRQQILMILTIYFQSNPA